MITRRNFIKVSSGGALALGTMATTGFSCSSVFTDISTYVPIGLQAFEEILALISPAEATLLTPIITEVKAGFADLAAAVSAYNNAPAANKATLEGKIATAINAVIGELQQFWNDTNLPDGSLASTIAGVLQIVLSTLAAFLPLVGGALAMGRKQLARALPITPQKRTQKQFKSDVNAVFAKYGYANRVY
jgi:hypothetical protein